jgi:hypothetical protein
MTETARQLTEVAKRETLPTFNLTPQTLSEAMQLAKLMAESDLVPKDYRDKPGNVLIAVQMGAEIGLSPMASVQSVAVINGKPSIYGDAGKAILLAAGCAIRESDSEEIRKTGVARCTITRPDGQEISRTFSKEDAKAAGLLGKQGPWSQYPERMLAWRAFWFAARDGAADYLKGMAGFEEVRDYEPRNITPAAEADLMPRPKLGTVEMQPGVAEAARNLQPPPPDDGKTRFEINGQAYATAGCTREQMLRAFDLAKKVDKSHGKGTAKRILAEDFRIESRNDLTEAGANDYIAKLELVSGVGAKATDGEQATLA